MARKESITQSDILQAAFDMAREEGYENVTARKLAARACCSTQPIFRVYHNMEELGRELYLMAACYFETYYEEFPKNNDMPFVDMGLAYIQFAKKDKHLFRLLFLSEKGFGKSQYDLLNGCKGNVIRELQLAKEFGCRSPKELFMKMWIFIHGAACMSLTGDYDLQKEETVKLLEDSFRSFLG